MSAYDAVATSFDLHRTLPTGVAEAIRVAALASIAAMLRPRLLDLGAGTGRIGHPFVAAGDDYVGVDLSLGMLREFRRASRAGFTPALVQGDGECLPFHNSTFDAVLLVQVVGAAQNWHRLVMEAQCVLRPAGALIVGHTVMPIAGIDAQMKQRLALFLDALGVAFYHMETRGVV